MLYGICPENGTLAVAPSHFPRGKSGMKKNTGRLEDLGRKLVGITHTMSLFHFSLPIFLIFKAFGLKWSSRINSDNFKLKYMRVLTSIHLVKDPEGWKNTYLAEEKPCLLKLSFFHIGKNEEGPEEFSFFGPETTEAKVFSPLPSHNHDEKTEQKKVKVWGLHCLTPQKRRMLRWWPIEERMETG